MIVWFSGGSAVGSKLRFSSGSPIMISGPENMAWAAGQRIGFSSAPHRARLVAAMAAGELAAIASPSACAVGSSWSGSTTWLTMPSCNARAADIRSYRPINAIRNTASAGILRSRPITS